MYQTKELLLEALLKVLPYPSQIKDLDLSLTNEIRFTWRSISFRVTLSGDVDEVGDGVLIGSNASILLRQILVMNYMNN